MPQHIKGQWIRVAGIAKRIRNLEPPPHWRFEVAGSSKQYLLSDFCLTGGTPTRDNNRLGTNPQAKDPQLFAWIGYYVESMTVDEDGLGVASLGQPPADQPYPW